MDEEKQKKIEDALYKKAVGYDAKEVVEEYILEEDGSMKLNKRKVTKKHISPDTTTAKVLLDHLDSNSEFDVGSMTDEELEKEKQRLLKLLKGEEND